MKSNNPSNLLSQSAKAWDMSYWEYMELKFPGCVKSYVWGVRKETRKEKRETQQKLMSLMTHPGNPMARLFAQMRSLIGRSAYR